MRLDNREEKAMLPSTTDELGVYLRKIGRTPLLNRDNEGRPRKRSAKRAASCSPGLLASDYSLRVVLAAARKAAEHKLRIDRVVDVQGIDAAARQEAFGRLERV